jgi:hypothetical protein
MSTGASATYTLPQTLVHQQVAVQVRTAIADLQPVIVGPQFDLKRYADKAQTRAGTYHAGETPILPWPNRPAGGVVDQAWTTVFVDDAYLKYWTSVSQLNLVANTRNHLRDPLMTWADYGSWPKSESLPARGVKVGDGVRVRAPAAGVDLLTQVIDFVHDRVEASVGLAGADGDNQAAQPASGAVTNAFGGDPAVTIPAATVDASGYDGAGDGLLSDNYTVTVTTGPGGDDSAVRFSVSSDSGDDDTGVALTGLEIDLGTRGATLTFDKSGGAAFYVGQTWEVNVTSPYTVPSPVAGGTYAGTRDTVYVLTVVRSGVAGGAVNPVVEIITNNGVDRAQPVEVGDSPAAIGSYGVTFQFGSNDTVAEGDQYLVPVTAAQAGPIHTLVLAHSLPAAVTTSTAVQIELMLRKDIALDPNRRGEPPLKNYTTDENSVNLGAVMTHFDPEVLDPAGERVRLELYRGDVHIQYRSLVTAHAYAVHEYFPENIAALSGDLGEIVADNPLALGLYLALQNAAVGNSTGVLYTAVPSNDYEGYARAIDRLVGRIGAYGIVPLTQDPRVHELVAAHVNAMSTAENGRWRVGWLNSASPDQLAVVAGTEDEPTLASLEIAPEDDGRVLTVVSEGGQFLTRGVRANDTLRVNYRSDGFDDTWTWDEYVVDRVISEDSLKLHRPADRETAIPIKIEIWRQLSAAEQAETYGGISGKFANRRIRHVWPPAITVNGVEVPGYFGCAVLAARRASVAPQQGLTNLPLYGIDAVPRTTDLMNGTDLNLMAGLGTWIITQSPVTGVVYTRHQLTTGGYGNLNESEDSVVTNFDSVSYQYLRAFEDYTGRVNVTAPSVSQLKAEWLRVTQQMQVAQDVMLGPQLVDVELISFAQHPILKDRVAATVRCSGPQPLNNFDLYLVI